VAYTTIDDPSVYFHTQLYTGNGSSNAITNGGNSDLQPDWLWIKTRSHSSSHRLMDSFRLASGEATLSLRSEDTAAESDIAGDGMTSLDSDGFTLNGSGSGGAVNESGKTYVAWQWKANAGTETTNQSESGSQIACSVQANTTAKFSIITYTGTGGNGHTFLHGLGSTPKVIIIKIRTGANRGWIVYHHKAHANPQENLLLLNTNAAVADLNRLDDTAPNSTEIAVSDDTHVNADGNTYVSYAFDEVQGYSKFGSYTGNGSATDGAFVYTGFSPAWVLMKRTSGSEAWMLVDSKRPGFNVIDDVLEPNDSAAEGASTDIDLLSNGFKLRKDNSNASGETYIFMAFASSPFVSSEGVPTTAR